MSVADFKAALKDKAYSEWFKNSSKSIFIQTSDSLRDTEQAKQKTSLLITEQDIKNIGEKLAGRDITQQEIQTIKADLLNAVKRREVVVRKDGSLFYPVINFKDGITNVLAKGFNSLPKINITDKKGTEREARVSDFFQKGHVFSIASNVTEQTKRNLASSNAPQVVKDIFIPILEEYIQRLKADDLASSNIKNSSFDLYAKYEKNPYKYIVEMQPEQINRDSGIASAPLTNALRRYFDPKRVVEIDKFFRTRATDDAFIQKLITSKGSPSYIDLLTSKVLEPLTKQKTGNSTYRAKVKLDTVKVSVDTKDLRNAIKAQITETQKAIDTLKKIASKSSKVLPTNTETYSLTSLKALLDAQLQHVISANMGDGYSKRVLNYRSGRFAASAKVERLTMSREGMITAFYSYMRNPYGTFSEGGAQQFPKSRDPKLLISQSIREIAATKVANRLRAVLV